MTTPTHIIIMGASGDLSRRKLIPALFSLFAKGRLPADFRITGFANQPFTPDTFRSWAREGLDLFAEEGVSPGDWSTFSERLDYVTGNFNESEDYEKLAARLISVQSSPPNRLIYLATPPRFYAGIISRLGAAGLTAEHGGTGPTRRWCRVVIEKPFGHDEESACALNESVHQELSENQIYRIDHYLGKETVQNILVSRFANAIYEPIWNRNTIDHVQITVAETVGVGSRAQYYDGTGAVRDMFQNHLLQLLSLVAMEPPSSFDAEALREEKVKVLKAVRPIRPEEVPSQTVRAQYRGYHDESGVAPDSETETYAAICFFVDNWRWKGVPFYLRSGKRLATKASEISIQFKRPPHTMFPGDVDSQIQSNILSLCLQPDEGIHLRSLAKVPDAVADMRTVELSFHYRDSFGDLILPDAYERLLLDVLQGDASLFTRADRSEIAWRLLDPILNSWEMGSTPLSIYDPGTWGPDEADEMMARNGRAWIYACAHPPEEAHGTDSEPAEVEMPR